MKSSAVLLKFDPALLAQIDAARGDVPRTVWITRACETALSGMALLATLERDNAKRIELTARAPSSILEELTFTEAPAAAPPPAGKKFKGVDPVTGKAIYK